MRLINADALYETLCHIWDRTDSEDFEKAVFREIENAPVVEERTTGKWIMCTESIEETFHTGSRCSVCNYWKPMGIWNYCPNCGAKMEGNA